MTDGHSLREVWIRYIHRSFLDQPPSVMRWRVLQICCRCEIYHGCQRGNLCETASKDVLRFVLAVLTEEKKTHIKH